MIEDLENLIEINDQFLVVLDSRNATTNNNFPMNSDIQFNLQDIISQPKDAISMKCSVISFSCPNSEYTINRTNNVLGVGLYVVNAFTPLAVYLTYGNYNATNFQSMIITNLNAALSANNILGYFNISLSIINFQFTLTHSLYEFVIDQNIIFDYFSSKYDSITLYRAGDVIGFANNFSYLSSTSAPFFILFPYPCNFSGINNINIHLENIRTNNKSYTVNLKNTAVLAIDQKLASNVLNITNNNIAASIPVNCNPNEMIYYQKIGTFEFLVKEELFDNIHITLQDDLGNLINLNNGNWNMTLEFNVCRLTKRKTRNFFEILQNPYPVYN